MKNLIIRVLFFLVFSAFLMNGVMAQKNKKKKKNTKVETTSTYKLDNYLDSVSYAVGLSMGINIKKDFSEAHSQAVIEGYKAAMQDSNYLIPQNNIEMVLAPYFKKKQEEKQAIEAQKSEQYKADGLKFLADNKNKPGVITTASGLQYIVEEEGTGAKPSDTSKVTVDYVGTTPDGTEFDSSIKRGQPATFGLNQVIKGWTEGLQLMKEGAKYKFFIPQELAYGANAPQGGNGPIKPYMPLVFEVHLIKVVQ